MFPKLTCFNTVRGKISPENALLPILFSGYTKPKYYLPPTLKQLKQYPNDHVFVQVVKEWYEKGWNINGWVVFVQFKEKYFKRIFSYYVDGKCQKWKSSVYDYGQNYKSYGFDKPFDSYNSMTFLHKWHEAKSEPHQTLESKELLINSSLPNFNMNFYEVNNYCGHYYLHKEHSYKFNYSKIDKILTQLNFKPDNKNYFSELLKDIRIIILNNLRDPYRRNVLGDGLFNRHFVMLMMTSKKNYKICRKLLETDVKKFILFPFH